MMHGIQFSRLINAISRDAAMGVRPSRPRLSVGFRGAPEHFAAYRDPAGRFELEYPSDWELDTSYGVCVSSPCAAVLARVDEADVGDAMWRKLVEQYAEGGAELEIRERIEPPRPRKMGVLHIGERTFDWRADLYEIGGAGWLLTACMEAGDRRSSRHKGMKTALEAIRRRFRATTP